YYKEYLKVFSIITLLSISVIYFCADFIIIRIFGIEYMESVQILKILLIGTIPVFLLRNPIGFILNAVGQAKINVRNTYIMLLINLILSVILTTKFGLIGTAFGTSATLVLGGFLNLYSIIKWLK
ncbi:polysaccharide biosynthesis C-terminal domain-containing protein, partial [Akkermansiaceae bacterium]|nr:polysaccharide biosynthesis C-terminal domain-containing protein [Akkermansiaceae bacterium]